MFELHQQITQMAMLLLSLPVALISYALFIEFFPINLSLINSVLIKKHKEILCLN